MTNGQIYAKTVKFSLMKLLVGLLGFLAFALITFASFWFSKGNPDACVWVTLVGLIVGIVVWSLLGRYLGYLYRAGQIDIIARGVVEGSLPDDVMAAAREDVSRRFVTANVFFALSSALSAINQQITSGVDKAATSLGNMSGSDTGTEIVKGIGAVISIFISIVLEYVTYCCLGWVFVHPDQNAFKAACDGAVIYFQNWKTLLKNAGKVFGLTLVSLLVIGGIFFGILYTATGNVTSIISAADLAQLSAELETDVDPEMVHMILVAIAAIILWALVHAAFVKPYVLVSAMRGYMEAAQKTTPAVDVYEKLCKLSARFKKTYQKAEE